MASIYDALMRSSHPKTGSETISRIARPGRSSPALEPSTRVLRQFRVVFNAVKTHFQRVEVKAGIGGAQAWALSLIRDKSKLGVNELAAAMDIHQSTASNLVRTLSEKGLIQVVRSSKDRRVVELSVTPAGRKVLQRTPGPMSGVLPQALASLDARTLQRLEVDLDELIAAIGVSRRAANTPLADM